MFLRRDRCGRPFVRPRAQTSLFSTELSLRLFNFILAPFERSQSGLSNDAIIFEKERE